MLKSQPRGVLYSCSVLNYILHELSGALQAQAYAHQESHPAEARTARASCGSSGSGISSNARAMKYVAQMGIMPDGMIEMPRSVVVWMVFVTG